jgi:hypothetical protein
MGTWTLFLLLVVVALTAGTVCPIAWVALRRRRYRGVPGQPSLSMRTCLGGSESLHGILLVNDGAEDARIDRVQYRVDGYPINGPSSQTGVLLLSAASLPPSKIRVCDLQTGTVLAPDERVWLLSVDPTHLVKTEHRELLLGLFRIGVEATYCSTKAPSPPDSEMRQVSLIPASDQAPLPAPEGETTSPVHQCIRMQRPRAIQLSAQS